MKHECKNCAWAEYADKPGFFMEGRTIVIQRTGTYRCTAGTIARMDISEDGMVCSSFRERDAANVVQES